MKKIWTILTLLTLSAQIFGQNEKEAVAAPAMVPVTYQGRLVVSGMPANGRFDLRVRVCEDAVEERCTDPVEVTDIMVENGIFTITPSFDSERFPADATQRLFLDISLKQQGAEEYTLLEPRQQLTFSPQSVNSLQANTALSAAMLSCRTNCITNAQIVSVAGSKVSGEVANATNAVNAANAVNAQFAANAVDLSSDQTVGGNKNFTGILSGNGSGLTNLQGTLKWNVVSGASQQAAAGNGYITVNTGQTTVTLPASPAAGDVIRIRAQGNGGFRIAQNAGQQIVESRIPGESFSSTPTENSRPWYSIASSADGTKLAAATSANGQIYTSTDSGVTWTARESNRFWYSIASSADGSTLAAVVNGGHIYTSTDSGVTWTARMTDTDRIWRGITSSADGTKLAAVVSGGQIYTSTNSGVTWTARESSRGWTAVTSSADGTRLAAAGGSYIYTSSDSGVTWTPMTNNPLSNIRSITSSANGTRLAAGRYGGQIYISSDSGVTWTARESDRNWQSITSSADGTQIAAAVDGGQIHVSRDSGETWTARESVRSWRSITSSSDGTRLAAVGSSTQIYLLKAGVDGVPATTIGITGYLTGDKFSTIELVYIGSGQFVATTATGNFRVQ